MTAHLRDQWRAAIERTAFVTRLDWRLTATEGTDQVWEAVYQGVRFVLRGSDDRGSWGLSILEPGDRVQVGLPWQHREPYDPQTGYSREVRSSFRSLDEAKRYVEGTIIAGGVIHEMLPRDRFEPGSIRYHLTLSRHVPSIMSRGLEPGVQKDTGVSVFDRLGKAGVILWDLKNEDWARHAGEDLALLQLDVSGLARTTIRQLHEERVNEVVPPGRITVLAGEIPWYLTEARFSTMSLSDAEVLRLLRGDIEVARRAWTGMPDEFDQIVGLVSASRTADMGTSWRPFAEGLPWLDHDAVIFADQGSTRTSRPSYEVWTHGELIASRPSLAEAKAVVEDLYGPLPWRRVRLDPVEVEHYYFGPTVEFSAPATLHVVDSLPRLGMATVQ